MKAVNFFIKDKAGKYKQKQYKCRKLIIITLLFYFLVHTERNNKIEIIKILSHTLGYLKTEYY